VRGNIKSFEKPFTHAEVVTLAERTLKRFGNDRNKAGRYARSMEDRYESAKWAQVVEVIATGGRHHATKKSPAQLQREIDEALARSPQGATRTLYEEAKAEGALLEQEVDAVDAVLKAFPRSPLGGASDAARETPEFRAANARFQRAFAALRAFNAVFTKRFAKEIRAERSERYSRLASSKL